MRCDDSGRGAWRTGCAALACVGLGACAPQSDGQDRAAGALAFQENCAVCHGDRGQGDTFPDALALDGLAAANGGVFPTSYVLSVVEGHGRDPEFSAAMPEFGGSGMGSGPVVEVAGIDGAVPARTSGLLVYLESIQK